MKEQIVGLHNLAHGAAAEAFGEELQRVLDNIADPNTKWDVRREVTLKLIIDPAEDRRSADVQIQASSKVAPCRPVDTVFYLGKNSGVQVAVESDARQMDLFDQKNRPVSGFPTPAE